MAIMAREAEVKPGYKLTEVGVIPEDWSTEILEKVCVPDGLVRGPFGGSLKKEFFSKDGFKVYEQRNAIYRNADIGYYFIKADKYKELKRFEVNEGDFIVSCSGTIGKIFQIPENAKAGIINQALLKIKTDYRVIYDRFFFYIFDWDKFQQKIIDNTQGGAMQNLVGMDIFRDTPIPLPPLSEQHIIATALSDVDDLITSVDKLITKKRDIKQATMQQLLTGKTRLPGFSEEWKAKKLGDVAIVLKGKGLSKNKITLSGTARCILYGELFTNYGRVISNVISSTNSFEGTLSNYGDVLVPGSTTTVGIDLVTASALLHADILLGGDINIIRAKGNWYHPIFLAYYLTESKRQEIAERTQGITIIHLYGRNLLDLDVSLASLDEQQAIATVLSDMDAEIVALGQRRDKTRALKQGMMQELLTGKTRLV